MKYIYIVTQYSEAVNYGVGTYYKQLENIFSLENGFHLCYINLFSKNETVSLSMSENISTINIPTLKNVNRLFTNIEIKYFKTVNRILSLLILDTEFVYFIFNHIHHSALIEMMKGYFVKSKFLMVFHYLSWIWEVKGNTDLYQRIVRGEYCVIENVEKVYECYLEELKALNSVDYIVSLSEDTYNLFVRLHKISIEKLFLIPNGLIDTKNDTTNSRYYLRSKWHLDCDEKVILYVGRFDELKGIEALLVSFNEIVNVYPKSKLFIVGDGDYSYVLSVCKFNWSKIVFTGKLNANELNDLYQISDIGVIPSYSEESSFVAIEMMKYGLPIVTSDARGLCSMFTNRVNALIAPIENYGNDKSFSNNLKICLLELFESEELCKKLRGYSYQLFIENYTLSKMKQQYCLLFDNI